MASIHRELGEDASQEELVATVAELNAAEEVDGILVQLPLPGGIDQDAVVDRIDVSKDVDGLTAASAGLLAQGRPGLVPCTPAGVMELLGEAGTSPEGAEAVIIGRSILVGRPLSALLLNADATVTVCHSRTRDLARDLPPGRHPRRRGRPPAIRRGRLGQARRDRHRRGYQPHRRRAGRRRRLRRGERGRGRDHARPGRRRPDDDRDAALEHPRGGARPRRLRPLTRIRPGVPVEWAPHPLSTTEEETPMDFDQVPQGRADCRDIGRPVVHLHVLQLVRRRHG